MNTAFLGINKNRVRGSVQYLAVAAGGNFQMGFPYGDTIAIFRLPR